MKPTQPLPQFPSRFGDKPRADTGAERPQPSAERVSTPVSLRRQYRRGPFYLKIDGLTGPRPQYDEFGRLIVTDSGLG